MGRTCVVAIGGASTIRPGTAKLSHFFRLVDVRRGASSYSSTGCLSTVGLRHASKIANGQYIPASSVRQSIPRAENAELPLFVAFIRILDMGAGRSDGCPTVAPTRDGSILRIVEIISTRSNGSFCVGGVPVLRNTVAIRQKTGVILFSG